MPAFLGKHVAVARREHDGQPRMPAPDLPAEFDPVHAGHYHVREHDIEAIWPAQQIESLIRIGCEGGLIAEVLQDLCREPTNLDVVLDHEHAAPAARTRKAPRARLIR